MKIQISFLLIVIFILFSLNCSRENNNSEECPIDISLIDFSFGIDYEDTDTYLVSGDQSSLSDYHFNEIINTIGTPSKSISGVMDVCHWVNQYFDFENAGGSMVGENTVDELFEAKKFYGCHSQALIISSILRKAGFPCVMIETASVQWGYDYLVNDINNFRGHVMTEVFIDNSWKLLDNNCTYVSDYDVLNPYISYRYPDLRGLFVLAKGIDSWDYYAKSDADTRQLLKEYSKNWFCYEDFYDSVEYSWEGQ